MRAQLHTREMRDMNVKAPDPAAPQHRVLSVFAALQRWCGEGTLEPALEQHPTTDSAILRMSASGSWHRLFG